MTGKIPDIPPYKYHPTYRQKKRQKCLEKDTASLTADQEEDEDGEKTLLIRSVDESTPQPTLIR